MVRGRTGGVPQIVDKRGYVRVAPIVIVSSAGIAGRRNGLFSPDGRRSLHMHEPF
jgi:hypothetical protein